MKRLLFAALALAAIACGSDSTPFLSKEYIWVQRDDGFAMKGPITYRIRWSWSKDTLNWAENVSDANGFQDLRAQKYFTDADIRERCEHWDDDNWSCVASDGNGGIVHGEAMKDGKLKWYYFGSLREMTTRHRIWNQPLPF